MRIDSHSVGDPTRFLSLDVLREGLDGLPAAPSDTGTLTRIVRRLDGGVRESLAHTRLTREDGVPGDAWGRDPDRDPVAQITVMQTDIAALIANGQPEELFGDQLFITLDLATPSLPVGTRVEVAQGDPESASGGEGPQVIGRDGKNAWDIAAGAFDDADTIYFLVNGQVKQGNQLSRGELDTLPTGTRVLVGYAHGGLLTARRRAFDVVGPQWNLASTYYRFPDGSIRSGADVDDKSIPDRTMVFFPR